MLGLLLPNHEPYISPGLWGVSSRMSVFRLVVYPWLGLREFPVVDHIPKQRDDVIDTDDEALATRSREVIIENPGYD